MTDKQAEALSPGDAVLHRRYGQCTVVFVMPCPGGGILGVQIEPDTEDGRRKLRDDANVDLDCPILESPRYLKPRMSGGLCPTCSGECDANDQAACAEARVL